MFKVMRERLRQGKRTINFPVPTPNLPDRFRGLPVVDFGKCQKECRVCSEVCPTQAISFPEPGDQVAVTKMRLDLGKCIFCGECQNACPEKAIRFTTEYSLASCRREDLILNEQGIKRAEAMSRDILKILGRSLKLRVVSAGDCNACGVEVNVLSTIVFDLGRFGIQYVASPRHADGIVITGPVPENMREALLKTYAAVPTPKVVISVGTCAVSGGLYLGHPEVGHKGPDTLLPVDLYIPGCPPHPLTILDGFLRLLGNIV